MTTGSKSKLCPFDFVMEGEFQGWKNGIFNKSGSILLELSATDDLTGFICEVEEKGFDVDEMSLWYGRGIGSKKMGFEERTPLMIASLYGSTKVLKYIIGTGKVDVNRACGSERATALHCAAAGGSDSSVEVVKLLLGESADINSFDASGNKPSDLIAPYVKSSTNSKRKTLAMLLKAGLSLGSISEAIEQEREKQNVESQLAKEVPEKKEYPIDISLPDINDGVYGTDEFRMFSFKVKPCSRAYSHDWTECPFVHPGENARRRDPRKYHYSCVPCPEFKKGACVKGDSCEYAHGVFESWLHPAQYRTRLCKDETGCSRKVCFFAHKSEELRPLYASTGSAMPSPKSIAVNSVDMATMSPLSLNSSSLLLPTTSMAPVSPSATCSSPMNGTMWPNKVNLTPPTLQFPSSRLKTSLNARDFELGMELLELESIRTQQQNRQQLIDELSGLSSPSSWNKDYGRIGELNPSTNLDDFFGQMQSLSPKVKTASQLQSPKALQMRNMNQLRSSYPQNVSSSPVRKPSTFGFDSSAAVAAAVMNSRSAAFAKRSQSFIDRGPTSHRSNLTSAANSATALSSNLSDWSSPNGKLDWGFNGEEQNKLTKSASFGYPSVGNDARIRTSAISSNVDEPDVSWVNSLVKDVSSTGAGLYSSEHKRGGVHDMIPPWVEQLYVEHEQMVA